MNEEGVFLYSCVVGEHKCTCKQAAAVQQVAANVKCQMCLLRDVSVVPSMMAAVSAKFVCCVLGSGGVSLSGGSVCRSFFRPRRQYRFVKASLESSPDIHLMTRVFA